MEHRIVFKNPDGSCRIIIPSRRWVFQPEADVAMAKQKASDTLAMIEEERRQTEASLEHRTANLAKFDALLKDSKDEDKDAHKEKRQILVAGLEEAKKRLSQIASEHSDAVAAKQVADELPEKMSPDDINARLELLAEKDVPAGLQWRITTSDKIPSDRTHRHAWTDNFDTDTVDVDEVKKEQMLNAVPEAVPALNAKLALFEAGLWDQLIEVAQVNTRFQIILEDGEEWRRDSGRVKNIAKMLKLADHQIDELFVAAGRIEP